MLVDAPDGLVERELPPTTAYFWTGYYTEARSPVVYVDWRPDPEDGREHALIDVLVKQFDQWGPERATRVLAYLNSRYGA